MAASHSTLSVTLTSSGRSEICTSLIFATCKEGFVNFNEYAGSTNAYGVFDEMFRTDITTVLTPVNARMRVELSRALHLETHFLELTVVARPKVGELENLNTLVSYSALKS